MAQKPAFGAPKDWTGSSWEDAAKAYAGYWQTRQSVSAEDIYKQSGGAGDFNAAGRGFRRPDQTEEDEALVTAAKTAVSTIDQLNYGGYDLAGVPGADRGTIQDWQALERYLVEDVQLPDIETFDPAAFDPYAHVRGTAFEASETKRTAKDLEKKYGLPSLAEGALSKQALDDAFNAYSEAMVRMYVNDPKGNEEQRAEAPADVYSRITDRNLLYAQYADLSKQFYNAQSAQGTAGTTLAMLQGKMRGLVRGKGNFFENLKESAEADVRIGSNARDQRKPKRTSRSTDAATARSRVLVRAPGINI